MPRNKNDELKVSFPQGKIYIHSSGKNIGKAYIEYNKSYVNKFNNNLNQIQKTLDNKVVIELQKYVSKDAGVQELSIGLNTDCGSGIVRIGVPYARVQAYSKKITKRVGLRGTQPFERMKADKAQSILNQVAAYSRRLNK